MVSKNDGWHLTEALWQRMEPPLAPRKSHPLGCHNPRVPDRAAMYGAMTKAPLAGSEKTGINPTDRAKQGVKRSVLTEGAGLPLAVVIDRANRQDMKLVRSTLERIMTKRPMPTEASPQGYAWTGATSLMKSGPSSRSLASPRTFAWSVNKPGLSG